MAEINTRKLRKLLFSCYALQTSYLKKKICRLSTKYVKRIHNEEYVLTIDDECNEEVEHIINVGS